MTELAAPALTPATVRRSDSSGLSWVRRIGYAVLGLQLIGFLAWSAIMFKHYGVTFDYAVDHQGWYQIAHGNLDPYDSPQHCAFWRVHGELIFWPLALLYWIWPHDLMLQWIQDFAVVTAEMAAFTWICELASRPRLNGHATWLAVVGLVLLAANTWTWQVVAWDYHTEALAVALLVLLIRDLANGRRRAWAWVAPMLVCGDVAGTYLMGVGLGIALAYRRARVRSLAIAGTGALQIAVIAVLHANVGSGHGLQVYAYLAGGATGATMSVSALVTGVLTHPMASLQALVSKSPDMWANLAPAGLLGVGFVPLLPLLAIVLLANNLWPGLLFSEPGFQSFPLYILVPAGTVAILGWLHQRHRVTALALSCLLAAQALAWAAVFTPRIPGEWLRVPAGAVATLSAAQAMIPPGAEVIASQGIAGRFSNRATIIPVMGPGPLLVHGQTWFIIAPAVGIETESTASAMAFIGELAGPLGATLVTHGNGVWVFRWRPPKGTATISVPGDSSPIEAWTAAGAAGLPVLRGPVSDWHAVATGADGYVADQLAWQVPTGHYMAEVTLATSGPVNVEVWNDTGNALLARRTVMATEGPVAVMLPVDAVTAYQARLFSGFWPFHADFIPPPPGQRLEVRVWSPGHAFVSVYSADLAPLPRPPHAEAGHQEPARTDRLVNGDVVGPGSGRGPAHGSGDHGDRGERRAGRLAAVNPQRYVHGAAVTRQ
jgi:hypothetical protein